MKRTFFLVIKALRPLQDEEEQAIVEKLFPQSDVKAHIADKLSSYLNRGSNFYHAIFDLYEGLDAEHQLWFDEAINNEIELLEPRFSPRSPAPSPTIRTFKNESRSRYYGLRIGDLVKESHRGLPDHTGEVIDYGHGDNNRVYVKSDETGEVDGRVAEWQTITTKVEDRTDYKEPS